MANFHYPAIVVGHSKTASAVGNLMSKVLPFSNLKDCASHMEKIIGLPEIHGKMPIRRGALVVCYIFIIIGLLF